MKARLLVFAVLASACSSVAQAQEVPVAKPATAWEAEFAGRDCGLKRHFQLGNGIVSLAIRQEVPEKGYELTVFAEQLERKGRSAATSFAGSEPLEHDFFIDLDSGEWEGVQVNLPANYFDASTSANAANGELVIREAFDTDFALDLQDLGSALEVMDRCLDDLLTSWGFDPVTYRSLSRKVAPEDEEDMAWYFRATRPLLTSSYAKEGNAIDIFLRVGTDGRVTECVVGEEVADTRAAKRSCENLERVARFLPALDADGRPVESFYTSTFRVRRI